RAAMAQCDAADGVRDGVMNNPQACKFNVASLRCAPGKSGDCLDDKQIEAVQKIYGPTKPRDNGEEIYPGFSIGSEWVEGTTQGWHTYFDDSTDHQMPKRGGYWTKWVFQDPKWNWWNFDWAKDVDFARKRIGPLVDSTDADMNAFHKRGGKLIVYTGW